MAKNIDDMIAPERRKSIRDIPIPKGRAIQPTSSYEPPPPPPPPPPSYMPPPPPPPGPRDFTAPLPRRMKPRKGIFIGGGIGMVAIIMLALSLFPGVTVSYTPKSEEISFEGDVFTATKLGEGGLLFSVVKLSRDAGVSVSVSGTEEVTERASGTIVVYNDNASSQRLIENTRFETPDGKVFRIRDAIVVPARTGSGSGTKPGSIEVMAYADETGESHNVALSDFTLPGLAGSAKFKTVYGRSKTPMTGGFTGTRAKITDADRVSAETELKSSINDGLLQEASAQVPPDFVLLPSLSLLTFENLPQTEVADGKANMNMRGNFIAIMFKREDLARHLGEKKTSLAPGEIMDIEQFDSLTFSFSSTTPADLLSASEITFSVSGVSTLVWLPDESALKEDLAGSSRSDVNSILAEYPSMLEANVSLRPFWKRSFPRDISKITIKRSSLE